MDKKADHCFLFYDVMESATKVLKTYAGKNTVNGC